MSNKTKPITYNLADRARQHGGVDRSDVNIRSMIASINAPAVQELVEKGDLFGYYGHEIRQRFGMNPPDTWVNPQTGESMRIEPALRTIELSADNDGNVTTRHEFLDTDAGKYSQKLYTNKAGGFSSAVMRQRAKDGKFNITGFHGYDYVRTPNYHTNRGDGMFDSVLFLDEEDVEMAFDSLASLTPQQALMKATLESAIQHQLDSMAILNDSDMLIGQYQQAAMQAQTEHMTHQQKLQNLRHKREKRQSDLIDAMVCPSVPFEQITAQWDSFYTQGTSDADLRLAKKHQPNTKSQERRERSNIFKRK